MTMLKGLRLTQAAVIFVIASQAHAQTPYPFPQPQVSPSQPEDGHYLHQKYGKPAYGYNHNDLVAVIGQLLGDRYSVTDRAAVKVCASAAMQQAAVRYQPRPLGNAHPYGEGYNPAALMRLTAITDVHRRQNVLRVSGLIDSSAGQAPNPHGYAYQNNGYALIGGLSFRCNVDYGGIVSNLQVHPANTYRG